MPADFIDLEIYVDAWALADASSRMRKRRASTMTEIRTFYDAMIGRLDSITSYLARYEAGEMPEDARRLMYLTLSLAEVSRSIEQYGGLGTEGLDESRFELVHEPKWPTR